MAKTDEKLSELPDWWQRERRQRQTRVLIFLGIILALIGYYYYTSYQGVTGIVNGIDFETRDHIAFVRTDKDGHSSLFSVRVDGTDLRPLNDLNDRSDKFAPIWTIGGKSLVYVSNRGDSKQRQIFILGKGEPRQLTYGSGNKDAPAISSDGIRAAFVTQGAIKTVNLNGTDVVQEIPRPRAGNGSGDDPNELAVAGEPQGPFLSASFSSDGHGIAGVQSLNSETLAAAPKENPLSDQLARAVPPGGDKALILDTGREVSVSWDMSHPRLACSYTEFQIEDSKGKPVLLNGINIWDFSIPDRPSRKPLIIAQGLSIEPKNISWSPDGKRIAFEAWRLKSEGVRELRGIAVINVTDQPILITPASAEMLQCMLTVTPDGRPQHPRWSPDGSRLLFERVRKDGGSDLWVVNSDGTNPINLTKGEGDNTQGAWAISTP